MRQDSFVASAYVAGQHYTRIRNRKCGRCRSKTNREKKLFKFRGTLAGLYNAKVVLSRKRHKTDTDYLQTTKEKGKGSPYSITERRVPQLIPVLGSQPAGDVSHKPDGRLPVLSARPAVTPATLKRAATNVAAW